MLVVYRSLLSADDTSSLRADINQIQNLYGSRLVKIATAVVQCCFQYCIRTLYMTYYRLLSRMGDSEYNCRCIWARNF